MNFQSNTLSQHNWLDEAMNDDVSKSQKKREADALQQLGQRLIAWNLDKLEQLPLTEPLLQAILAAKTLRSHGAIRRQGQLIGKLMRSSDSEAIMTTYNAILAEENAQTTTFHDVEQWRTRLLTEGKEALTEFIATHHPEDLQHLRQLIKKAIIEQGKRQHTDANRALFRFLRSTIT